MKRHISFQKNVALLGDEPDLNLLEGVVSERILQAMLAASRQFESIHVPHALAGALAVGAYGYPRATKDVDYLVGDEAFHFHGGGLVTIAAGVPIAIGDVAVDPMSTKEEPFLLEAIRQAVLLAAKRGHGTIPVLPLGALVYLKLKSPRRKDEADIIELVKRRDIDSAAKFVYEHAPQYTQKLIRLIDLAYTEAE